MCTISGTVCSSFLRLHSPPFRKEGTIITIATTRNAASNNLWGFMWKYGMQTPSTQMPTFTWQRTHFRPADKFAPTVHLVHTQAYNIYALFTRSFRTVRWFRVNGLGTFSLSCPLILSLFWFPYMSSSSTLLTQDQKRILGTRVPRGLNLSDWRIFRKYLTNRFETEIFQHYRGIVYSFQLVA